ncbi:ribosomal protein S18-alanine N-acetyltransferase [Williamsia herbipolensis]|uniref:ribosomal protein S18-alanine N-acetyltransferase n=1 Tax=Williamsia herbipolensis TaxID=1603258 RepID=UPI0005F79B7E|nr:ribosomal protein S18-alanine N-acetyltransferase [Williamsia herbipolensis]
MIGPLAPADAARCAELEAMIFPDESPWPVEAFTAEIASPHNRYFAARDADGQTLIGYAGISLLGRIGTFECEIHTIAVDPAHRGAGHGAALMAAMLEVADSHGAEVFLEVRTDNDVAIDMYRHNGFEQMGLRKRYYQPSGADAYTMRRPPRSSGEGSSRQGGGDS